MTSTAGGGSSFGRVNRELIASGKLQPHINVFGGEDRLWLGPEGSQYSIYFAPEVKFASENWYVPAPLDTLPFETVSRSKDRALFRTTFELTNYSGTQFQVAVEREIRLLDRRAAWRWLGLSPAKHLPLVSYESNNTLINSGHEPWKKETGLLSIWIFGMLNASPATTVVVPIKAGPESVLGAKVTPYVAYGAQPPERLQATNNAFFFRGDAQFRGKIGIGPKRSLGVLGSYDTAQRVLTLVQFSQPSDVNDYVNSAWGPQEHPYGDAINSYNDGPPAPGTKPFGSFYELETSSPAVALAPRASLKHTHRTFHLTGPEEELDAVARAVLGVSLARIAMALPAGKSKNSTAARKPASNQKAVLLTGASTGIGRNTNPLCIAAPGAQGKTLCLDLATSIVPWNVIANAQSEGVPVPKGWAVDAAGRDTTDAQAVMALYPFGEYKGSGLGILIDVLCAMLSGAPFGPDIPKMYGDLTQHRQLGGLVGAIDVSAFTKLDTFTARVAEMATRLAQLKPANHVDRVRFPGEPELETRSRRAVEGIPIGKQVFAELNALAAAVKIAPLVPASSPLSADEVSHAKAE